MDYRAHFWKNIGFALLLLFLWAITRYFHARLLHGPIDGFRIYDILFIFIPPLVAFFMNWRWMREQHTDTIVKWSVSWAAVDLAALILAVFLLRDPLNLLIQHLPA